MPGLYIHIPFCNEKCTYCDFFSGNQLYLRDSYVDAICQELNYRGTYLENKRLDTIYFGGGTPSLLSKFDLSRILNRVVEIFVIDSSTEITLECNPENIDDAFLQHAFQLGINRISLGIQFMDNEILANFNRKHSKELIVKALDNLDRSDFTNLSVDIIYAVPGIDDNSLLNTLKLLSRYDIKHFSAYSLTIAKNSKLYWKIGKGEFVESSENEFINQYLLINNFLSSKGYIQYEISNYAKEGFFSRHNLAYWNQVPYLGIGVSAHSYNSFSRQWNHTNIKKYIREMNQGLLNFEVENLNLNQIYNEYIILKLRTLQGISVSYIGDNFQQDVYLHFVRNMDKLIGLGHFIREDDLIMPKQSDLLIADYLAKNLVI